MKQLLLVRHGQASFGKRDYDALSDRGHEQARVLGAALAAQGVVPDLVVRGRMRRHEETAAGLVEGLGAVVAEEVDGGWDEFDFQHVLEAHRPHYRSRVVMMADLAKGGRPREAFEVAFREATSRWTSGDHDGDYEEAFTPFVQRTVAALHRAAALEPDRGTALVVTSGGPVAACTAHLLGGDERQWARLNRVTVNTGTTKVLSGRSGLTLSTFNAHDHLVGRPGMLTYR